MLCTLAAGSEPGAEESPLIVGPRYRLKPVGGHAIADVLHDRPRPQQISLVHLIFCHIEVMSRIHAFSRIGISYADDHKICCQTDDADHAGKFPRVALE